MLRKFAKKVPFMSTWTTPPVAVPGPTVNVIVLPPSVVLMLVAVVPPTVTVGFGRAGLAVAVTKVPMVPCTRLRESCANAVAGERRRAITNAQV